MPLISTRGAASAQGFGEFAQSAAVNYIENVFSTYLYTGNGSTQTITNDIDLSGKGGLLWIKRRNGANYHSLFDSATSSNGRYYLISSLTDGLQDTGTSTAPFTSSGFSLNNGGSQWNNSAGDYVSWTFRKQAKFFDVVTFTGTGASQTVSHNLGSTPGFFIQKRTDSTSNWIVLARETGGNYTVFSGSAGLNSTAAGQTNTNLGSNLTSTTFNPWNISENVNGATYVVYLFAHNAGGFGLSGSDNVISCGSFTADAGGSATVTLGYEPQFYLRKIVSDTGDWLMIDNMRGFTVTEDRYVYANTAGAEGSVGSSTYPIRPTATGFIDTSLSGSATYIYITIRRGPMKVPTSGTSVFSPNTSSGVGGTVITTGFPLDASLTALRAGGYGNVFLDRLRGFSTVPYGTSVNSAYLVTNTTGAEQSLSNYSAGINNTGFQIPNTWADSSTIYYSFRRAPGFFDVVCYTGTGSATTVTHNLGVVPELMIVKKRSAADAWVVYANNDNTDYLVLNTTAATVDDNTIWNDTSPTSSVFTVGTNDDVNGNTATFVAYLFATVAGVSKVGTYTGSGTTKQIDCGFTGGARFVLIKRTDSTGDWYVYDTARGIVSGNDPYLFLNSTAAEVTNTDYVDTYSAGFELSSTAPAGLNANGGTYIFLAIA